MGRGLIGTNCEILLERSNKYRDGFYALHSSWLLERRLFYEAHSEVVGS